MALAMLRRAGFEYPMQADEIVAAVLGTEKKRSVRNG